MKILEVEPALVTNSEVCTVLEEKLCPESSKTRPASEASVLSGLIHTYGRQPCAEAVKSFLKAAQAYDLSREELLQLVNLRPNKLVELYLIIPDCEDRFGNDSDQVLAHIQGLVRVMGEETSATEGSTYFDVHAALADDVRLPVKLVHGAKKVAPSLDPATGTPDLEAGARLDLPLWALKPLMQQGLAEARPPPFYGRKLQRKLKAGASCEDLRVRCPYFYDVGCTLHSLGAATPELANFLNETFADRYKDMLVHAMGGDSGRDVTRLQSRLCAEEAALFDGGRASLAEFQRWRASRGIPVVRLTNSKRQRFSAAARPPLASISNVQ